MVQSPNTQERDASVGVVRSAPRLAHFAIGPLLRAGLVLIALVGALWWAPAMAEESTGSLSVDQRVACSTTLRDLDWSHTLWPKENPGPKPARSGVLSDATIRAQVETRLRMENALLALYKVRLDAAALQTEMNRMALGTRAPERLREMFAALNNDPVMVAECLARPLLAERRLREAYAHDVRWHGDLKVRAQDWLAGAQAATSLEQSGGREDTVVYVLRDADGQAGEPLTAAAGEIALTADEFARERARLQPASAALAPGSSAAPMPSAAGLRETESAFIEETLLSASASRIEVRSRVWVKVGFDPWWQARAGTTPMAPLQSLKALQLPVIAGQATDLSKAAADTWRREGFGFSLGARIGHTAVWTGSEMIVWGGSDRFFSATGGRYNPASDSWSATQSSGAPTARGNHTAVWTGSEMIVWGGFFTEVNNGVFLATGGRYNPASDSWSATQGGGAPTPRENHTAVWTGSEMIVWGGGGGGSVATGGRYNPSSNSWTATQISGAHEARRGHTAVWTGSEMVVWGGVDDSGSDVATGARYNPASDSWMATQSSGAPAARFGHTAVWTGSEMIVWGGDSSGPVLATGGRYNPASDTWMATQVSGAPAGRRLHTAVWTGSLMIIWGGDTAVGSTDGSDHLATGGRYNPVSDSWTATSAVGPPVARNRHTAVWTGSEMIVWGGGIGFFDVLLRFQYTPYNSGGRYNPTSNSWTETRDPGIGTLTGRGGDTAVWTGSELIVWGGDGKFTGGRYNPASDTWTATQVSGAPQGRSFHSAVWTGREMIVWGGYIIFNVGSSGTFFGDLDSGGRYNPASDSWLATPSSGAPTARIGFTAVWTGIEMIIWGGYPIGEFGQPTGFNNTGGRYNPASDSWAATQTSGAPQARSGHTAVWTGSELIVWGGYNGVGSSAVFLTTGGRYNPTIDSWSVTQVGAAPEARSGHTAVWTGSEMIVWGGYGGGASPGGRYNPTSDSWTRTQASGAPTARGSHTAVWTGSEMIVWGGLHLETNNRLATGGRYNPASDNWTPTQVSGAPERRDGHTAVWTGSAMIVWGGNLGTGAGAVVSMGVYYPYTTAADEPSIARYALPTPNPPDANCPAGFFIVLVGDGPGEGITNGVFGTEVLLEEPGTRILAGGLNFGGLFDVSQPGFAGVNIANSGNEQQRLNVSLKGNPASSIDASISVRVRVGLRTASSSTTVYETTTSINQAAAFEASFNVPPGFYEATVTPLSGTPLGGADGQFSLSLTTSFIDRAGGGFQGGAVIGGYHSAHPLQGAGGYSGFAGFCLATPHATSIRVLSRPSYGITGARDLRLRIWDAQLRELVVVPN